MKKILSILFFIIISLISLTMAESVQAADPLCTIKSVTFSDFLKDKTWQVTDNEIELQVDVENCVGGIFMGIIDANNPASYVDISNMQEGLRSAKENYYYVPPKDGVMKIKYRTGEDDCIKKAGLYDCRFYIDILDVNKTKIFNNKEILDAQITKDRNGENIQNLSNGILMAECKGSTCVSGTDWKKLITNERISDCKVESATFSPKSIISSGLLKLSIETTDCKGGITISIPGIAFASKSKKTFKQAVFANLVPGGFALAPFIKASGTSVGLVDIGKLSSTTILIPPENGTLELSFKATGEECSILSDPNCVHGLIIGNAGNNNQLFSSLKEAIAVYLDEGKTNIAQSAYSQGVVASDCSGISCTDTEAWRLAGSNALNLEVDVNGIQNVLLTKTFDTESPCYDEVEGAYDPNCYELLAPIPGIGETDSNGRTFIKNLDSYRIGDYINQLFTVALAVLIVISIIMIIIAGLQYMTVESIYGKSNAKSRIINAVIGLILGLGIFIILNTINPKLLEVNFSENIPTVTAEFKELSPEQLAYIGNIDVSGIQIGSDIYTNQALITYLYHQQGVAGGPSILWAAKNGVSPIPNKTPFYSNGIRLNHTMSVNHSPRGPISAAKFVEFWYKRLKAKEKEIGKIKPEYAQAIEKAAQEAGVDVTMLKTICMVESFDCSKPRAINGSYKGLFQMGPAEFKQYGPKNGDIFDPYDNALAGARYAKYHLTQFAKHRSKF